MDSHQKRASLPTLTLAALGVVYGDIGTSPLYALKESLAPVHIPILVPGAILGVLSLIFWALMIVVSLKYVLLVMRADNQGEGGILALTALASRTEDRAGRTRTAVIALGLVGASMFYGDSIITPAISVLSAVEGLEIVSPHFSRYVLPITIGIVTALFIIQKRGTERIGKLFGPITILWFLALGVAGIVQIAAHPEVLAALNPLHGARFLAESPIRGFFVLGSVFLAVTGGEALYADMGHFGARPIRLAWFGLVLPSLALNYFGQGALLLGNPAAITNPFYLAFPDWAVLPMVFLATAATVIASQAVISGAFSMTAQAIKLGYCPRMQITHTSAAERGQVYVPFVNWTLFVAVVLLVLGFKTSSNLASAYGIAVATTMVVTTLLCAIVAKRIWGWDKRVSIAVFGSLALLDLAFLAANTMKIAEGGWFPLLVGAICYLLLITWKRGRALVAKRIGESSLPLDMFINSLELHPPHRVEGTAVFMTAVENIVPHALLHNLKHNQVLHHTVLLFSIATLDVPRVPEAERMDVESLGFGFYRITAKTGFQEEISAEALIRKLEDQGIDVDPMRTSYFLARESVIPTDLPGMPIWQEHLFSWMNRNAQRATDFFRLPANRVVELGTQVEI